jgi:hypothetical protein
LSGAGHSDRLLVSKAAAWYALIDKKLDEILSCDSEPVFKAYLEGLCCMGFRLWKFIMPVEARSGFQLMAFHPTTVSEKLQQHPSMTIGQRIFNKCFSHSYIAYCSDWIYFAYSQLAG